MPTVTCPACGRHIDLPDAEMPLLSITCARCDNHFCPATGQLLDETAVAVLDGTGCEPTVPTPEMAAESAPGLQPGTKAAIFVLVGVLGLFGVLLVVALSSSRKKDQQPAKVERAHERPRESAVTPPPEGAPLKEIEEFYNRLERQRQQEAEKAAAEVAKAAEEAAAKLRRVEAGSYALLVFLLGLVILDIIFMLALAPGVRARDPDHTVLWCLAFLFGSLLAILFWLFARPPLRSPPA